MLILDRHHTPLPVGAKGGEGLPVVECVNHMAPGRLLLHEPVVQKCRRQALLLDLILDLQHVDLLLLRHLPLGEQVLLQLQLLKLQLAV